MKKAKPTLVSAVFVVAPTKPLTLPGHLGRAVNRFWIQYVKSRDAALVREIHDNHKPALRPFTCSTLVGGEWLDENSQMLHPDRPCWFRITALAPETAELLLELAAAPPSFVELDRKHLSLVQTTIDPAEHGWAGVTTYEDLAAPYLMERRPRPNELTLVFVSPTTFRMSRSRDRKKRTWPVPMPYWVFGSLHRRWNTFTSLPLYDDFLEMVDESLVLTQYHLQTVAVPTKQKIPQMGCVGSARYVLLDKDEFWASRLQMLGAYAFYAGVGYQTTAGLGQTRLEEQDST